MKRPINLREETWQFLHASWLRSPDPKPKFPRIAANPGVWLFQFCLKDKPELLANTVICLPNEVEYLIDHATAIQISYQTNRVALIRLYDHRSDIFDRSEVVEAIKYGGVFDQLVK